LYCIVENLFISEFPGPVIVGAYLGISTSYALFELGTNIPPVVDAIAWQFKLISLFRCPAPGDDVAAQLLLAP
jgi:hypothetical protein